MNAVRLSLSKRLLIPRASSCQSRGIAARLFTDSDRDDLVAILFSHRKPLLPDSTMLYRFAIFSLFCKKEGNVVRSIHTPLSGRDWYKALLYQVRKLLLLTNKWDVGARSPIFSVPHDSNTLKPRGIAYMVADISYHGCAREGHRHMLLLAE